MIVAEADEDIELSPDPFKEAGINIPKELPYKDAERPAISRQVSKTREAERHNLSRQSSKMGSLAGSRQNILSNMKHIKEKLTQKGPNFSTESIAKISEDPESEKLIISKTEIPKLDTLISVETPLQDRRGSCPIIDPNIYLSKTESITEKPKSQVKNQIETIQNIDMPQYGTDQKENVPKKSVDNTETIAENITQGENKEHYENQINEPMDKQQGLDDQQPCPINNVPTISLTKVTNSAKDIDHSKETIENH